MFSRELFNKCSTHECVFKPPGCAIFNYLLSVTEYICTYACLNTLVYSLLCFDQFIAKFFHEYSHWCFTLLNSWQTWHKRKCLLLAKLNLEFLLLVTVSWRSWSEESLRSNTDNQQRREEEKWSADYKYVEKSLLSDPKYARLSFFSSWRISIAQLPTRHHQSE